MRRIIIFIMSAIVCVLCFACLEDSNSNNDYKNSLPDWDALKITLPESTAARFKDSEKQIAKSYLDAVSITRDLNPVLYYLLSVVDEIVTYQPTSIDGSTKIWESDEPLSGLSAVVPRFTLGETEVDGVTQSTYTFEIRDKNNDANDADSFVKIWWGTMTPDNNMARRGSGKMTIDFDAAKSVDINTKEQGLVVVDYDIRADFDRTIDITFEDFHADDAPEDTVINATYEYLDAKDNSGSLKFSVYGERFLDANSKTVCLLDFDVMWLDNGVGQSIVSISECDIENGIDKYELNECWDDSFYRTYYLEMAYFSENNPPAWANGLDNPAEVKDSKFGDIEECPDGF